MRTAKICLLGDQATGKTSLVRRFAYNTFERHYTPSNGLTVSSKTVVVAHDGQPLPFTLVLWDPASSHSSPLPYAAFLDSARAVILVADVARAETVASLAGYVAQARHWNPDVRFGLAANKSDLAVVDSDLAYEASMALAEMAAQLDAPLHYTSALRDLEVDALFRALAVGLARDTTHD
ncbi:MAG: Rab family GTPase [Caldilineaceae bacterium]